MEEIDEESKKIIVFPELDYLSLDNLENVKRFSSCYSIEFPLLRALRIISCNTMRNFVSKFSSNESEEFLFNEMVSFSKLDTMVIRGMNNFKYLWDEQFIADDSFFKLKSISILYCSKLSVVFPSKICTRFQILDSLRLYQCDGVEQIYQQISLEEIKYAFSLRDLRIWNLHSLKHIWNKDACGAFSTFENLQLVKISSCEDLKYVFPASMVCGLVQLQRLHIRNCNLEVIIAKDKNETSDPSFQFPELTKLKFMDLKEMKSLYEGPHTFQCPKLKSMKVKGCSNIFFEKHVFTTSMVKCFSQLKELEVEDCESVEDITLSKEPTADLVEVIEFSHMASLKLKNLPHLRGFCSRKEGSRQMELTIDIATSLLFNKMVSFPNLTCLEMRGCRNLNYMFTKSMLKCLMQLKKLKIAECESVNEIILSGEFEEEITIVFPTLDYLSLDGLPNLIRFSGGYRVVFQSLKEILIVRCGGLKTFVSKLSGRSNNNESEEYLFGEMVTFPRLESIIVRHMNNFKCLCHEQFSNSVFKLKLLEIECCSKLSIVFPPNVLRRFKELETLYLSCCPRVEEIYQYQGIDFEETNIVEAFALRDLQITNLPSLKHIWSKDPIGAATFEHLQSMKVYSCMALKYVFPKSIACGLHQLQQLKIRDCDVEVIIAKAEDERAEGATSFMFPQLTLVQLENLNEMRSLYPGLHTFECPKLKCLGLTGCDRVMMKAGNTPSQQSLYFMEKCIPNLEELTLDHQGLKIIDGGKFSVKFWSKLKKLILCFLEEESIPFLFGFLSRLYSLKMLVFTESNLEEIFSFNDATEFAEQKFLVPSFLRLKNLEVAGDDNLKHILKKDSRHNPLLQFLQTLKIAFCDDLINIAPSSASFQYLTSLNVGYCENIIHLVTASAAKTMVHLIDLRVSDCYMMEEVVANDGDPTEHDEIIFNELKYLELNELPRLRKFCSSNYTLNFPSLEQVVVEKCYQMKGFPWKRLQHTKSSSNP